MDTMWYLIVNDWNEEKTHRIIEEELVSEKMEEECVHIFFFFPLFLSLCFFEICGIFLGKTKKTTTARVVFWVLVLLLLLLAVPLFSRVAEVAAFLLTWHVLKIIRVRVIKLGPVKNRKNVACLNRVKSNAFNNIYLQRVCFSRSIISIVCLYVTAAITRKSEESWEKEEQENTTFLGHPKAKQCVYFFLSFFWF